MFALSVGVAVAAFGQALSAGMLWLTCRLSRVRHPAEGERPERRVGFGRALALALAVTLLDLGIGAAALSQGGDGLTLSLAAAVASVVATLVVLRLGLPASLGRVVVVGLVWRLAGGALGVGLALSLWAFAMRGYVNPTGGMAEAMYGHHLAVVCPSCGHPFAVGSPGEEEQRAHGVFAPSCVCPNCLARFGVEREGGPAPDPALRAKRPPLVGGDRFLAGRGLLGPGVLAPGRFDPVVFEHPDSPRHTADGRSLTVEYVQRLMGLPGEALAIQGGNVYVLPADRAKELGLDFAPAEPADAAPRLMARDDPRATKLFEEGKFDVLRKPPAKVLAMMRLVHDDRHRPEGAKSRWSADRNAKEDGTSFVVGGGAGSLTYRHLLPRHKGKPSLIADHSSYEALGPPGEDWVGELILECDVDVTEASGDLSLRLSKGPDRFSAVFDLTSGECRLVRHAGLGEAKATELKKALAGVKAPGRYRLRFADVDDRLTVWVNDRLPFGEGVPYEGVPRVVPTKENDLDRPASIDWTAAEMTVRDVRLFRDAYFTSGIDPGEGDVPRRRDEGGFDVTDPATFARWGEAAAATFHVRPGHYFVLGDNSKASSDSRSWGLVPEGRVRGKVLLRYWPLGRWGAVE